MNEFEVKTYYAIALDPVHVGAGGAGSKEWIYR